MDKNKILLGPSQLGIPAINKLEKSGFEIIPNPYKRKLTKEELKDLLKGVDGIIAGLEPLDEEILKTSTLKVISRCGSGIANVDTGAASRLGIKFYYTPFGPTASVAEMTLANILVLLRNITIVNKKMHDGVWEKNTGSLLMGKTVLIIGFGKIGQSVAKLLVPFNIDLLVVDPYLKFEQIIYSGSYKLTSLEEALPNTDIVLVHSSSEEMILSEKEFRILKKGALILNASRGSVIDETYLIEAIESKTVSGAWLDVFNEEPYKGPLCKYENIILTPHIASYTEEGRTRMENEAVENLIKGFQMKGEL